MSALSGRQIVLAAGAVLVLLAKIGAVYLEIAVQSRATMSGWIVTRDLPAGSPLTKETVVQVQIPAIGDSFRATTADPVSGHWRLSHAITARHLLSNDDLTQTPMVHVPLALKAAPSLAIGDSVDIYALVGVPPRPVLIGRNVTVDAANGAAILVPAPQEGFWITLSASAASLYAAQSSGIDVPNPPPNLTAPNPDPVTEAITSLARGAVASGP